MALKTITLEMDGSSRRARKAGRYFSEGWAHQKKREWREAVACYNCALDVDPRLFAALANRGMCWHQLGKPVEALADYERAFALGTPDLRNIIRVNRGVLLGSVRRYDEALADFATDDSPESRLNAAYIHLMRGNFWQGLELYRSRPTVKRWGAKLPPACRSQGQARPDPARTGLWRLDHDVAVHSENRGAFRSLDNPHGADAAAFPQLSNRGVLRWR